MSYDPNLYSTNPYNNDWYRRSQNQAAAANTMNTGGTGGTGSGPSNPDPNSPEFQAWLAQHQGDPTTTTPYPVGTQINGTKNPGGVNFNRPTIVPDVNDPRYQQQAQVYSMNPGTDPNRPPDSSGDWFWSGTGSHWVDKTGQRDATGRLLTDAEKTYWGNYDHARASAAQSGEQSLFYNYLKQNQNPGLPAGQQAQYGPTIMTTAGLGGTQPQTPVTPTPAAPVPTIGNAYGSGQHDQFAELQGVLNAQQLQAAQDTYGWLPDEGSGATADPNAAYARRDQLAMSDPNADYSVVQFDLGQGVNYGIVKRERTQAAQQARGFYAPGYQPPAPVATPHSVNSTYRGGGSSGGGSSKPVYTGQQIAQQQAIGKYGAGAINFAAQHMPTPAAPPPNGSRGRTNSPR